MRFNRRETIGLLAAGSLSGLTGCKSDPPSSSKDLAGMDAISQTELVKSGTLSPTELVQSAIQRVQKLDPKLNAFTDFHPDRALEKAGAVDASLPFGGLPYALKDLN